MPLENITFNLQTLLLYALAIVTLLCSPGPVAILVANASIKGGFKAGFSSVVGTNLSSLVLIALSFVVIQGVLAVNPQALAWLTIIGSVYLLYYAIQIFMSKAALPTDAAATQKNSSYFINGFLVGVSNPKDILFFIAFFPSFLKVTSYTPLSMVILVVVWVVFDYVIMLSYALFLSKISNTTAINGIYKLSGAFLFFIGVLAIYKSAESLVQLQ